MLEIKELHYSIGSRNILRNISGTFLPGEFNMILGPNGSGKSTLLKLCSGELLPNKGAILYEKKPLSSFSKTELARRRAVLSQHSELNFPLTVEEVVMMGRYPHYQNNPTQKDKAICEEAMETLHIQQLVKRNYLTLSGGEKQRVHFARVLAQIWEVPINGCRFLFLDEPLGHLDINYQHAFLRLSKALLNTNTVLIAVMHDINLSIQYADKLVFLKDGEIKANGTADQIISSTLIENVFDIKSSIVPNPLSAKPFVICEA